MLPDRVSNPGPLTYESGALPIALRGPAFTSGIICIVLQRYNGKCRKLSCKNFHAQLVTFTPRYGQLILGNTLTRVLYWIFLWIFC